jgi:hypothetical protein
MTTIRSLWRRGAQWATARVRPVRDPDVALDPADAEFWAPTAAAAADDTAPLLPVLPPPAPAWDPTADTGAIPVLTPRPIGPRHAGHRPDPLTDVDARLEDLWATTPIFAGVLLDAGYLALPAGPSPDEPVDEPAGDPDVVAAIDRLLEVEAAQHAGESEPEGAPEAVAVAR